MPSLAAAAGRFYSIPQSANAIRVSEKTIRNYIDRGIVYAEKWNGSWRITHDVLSELFQKKYGISLEVSVTPAPKTTASDSVNIEITRREYDSLLKNAGRAEATEELIPELRNEIRDQSERMAQLEASSASGWTEARRYKQDIDEISRELEERRDREEELKRNCDWLRRELDRAGDTEEQRVEELREAREEIKRLLSALNECESTNEERKRLLSDLEERYRRDGFLD